MWNVCTCSAAGDICCCYRGPAAQRTWPVECRSGFLWQRRNRLGRLSVFGCLLVIESGFDQRAFGKRAREEFEADGQAVSEKPTRYADGREREARGKPAVGARRRFRY